MSITKNSVLFLLLAMSFSACQTHSVNKSEQAPGIFADSLYLFTNYTGLVNDTLTKFYDLSRAQADSDTKKKVLDNFYPFSSSYWNYTNIHYVARQHSVGNIQPVILSIGADDYSALVLVTFDAKCNVIDRKELSGGLCGGPDEEDDSCLVDCASTHAIVTDSNHIEFYKIRLTYPALYSTLTDSTKNELAGQKVVVYDSIPIVDSFSYKVEIKNSGKIISTLIDSVRLEIHKNKK